MNLMTESEWNKLFEDGVLTPTRMVNSLWYSKDDVEGYLKELRAGFSRLQEERDLFELKYKGMDKINQFNIQEADKEHEKLEAYHKWANWIFNIFLSEIPDLISAKKKLQELLGVEE